MSNTAATSAWFSQFSEFTYDNTTDIRSNFNRLATGRNWGSKRRGKSWVQCQTALFGSLYGTNTNKLVTWQNLCTDVGIPGPPSSINACRKVRHIRNHIFLTRN